MVSMTDWMSILYLVGAGAEKHDSTSSTALTDGPVEQRSRSGRICDRNVLPGVFYHGSVSQFGHMNVAFLSYELFERTVIETRCSNTTGNPNVYENWRIEASTSLKGIESLDKVICRGAPPPVPEGVERNGVFSHHGQT